MKYDTPDQNTILTYTGVRFNPLEAEAQDIRIEDIAHALSLMTRANGHLPHFYSVAQHSLNCANEALARGHPARVQLGLLLHDASESYISDITRPVKRNLPEYVLIEARLQETIYARFGLGDLTGEELMRIEEVDDALLYHEFLTLMGCVLWPDPPKLRAEHDLGFRLPRDVERAYIERFDGLYREACEKA